MTPELYLALYCVLVVGGSLLGGWLPTVFRWTHLQMQLVLSGVGGLMLGIGLLHLLPHSIVQTASLDASMLWVLVGLLGTFFMIRMFHFHSHADESESGGSSHVRWAGVVFGLSVHTLIDGLALAAGVAADARHGGAGFWGLGVFLAIFFHKPLDALSLTSIMRSDGWSLSACQAANVGFSLMCPLGAAMVWAGLHVSGGAVAWWLGACLGLAAGSFLCISLSDLLPELQFHEHDRWPLSMALILGVLLALLVGWMEPDAAHHLPRDTHGSRSGEGYLRVVGFQVRPYTDGFRDDECVATDAISTQFVATDVVATGVGP